jgi:hypothetical protein
MGSTAPQIRNEGPNPPVAKYINVRRERERERGFGYSGLFSVSPDPAGYPWVRWPDNLSVRLFVLSGLPFGNLGRVPAPFE